jgi:hypothetical protein
VDGQVEETTTCEPLNDEQERIFTAFAGGSLPGPPRRYVPVGKDLFAPAGMPLAALSGYARRLLVSRHAAAGGMPGYRCVGERVTRRG